MKYSRKPKIAIVGAGIAGLTLAKQLGTSYATVCIYEKSRGVGGRLATRYNDSYQFDHGCPSFTAESSLFTTFIQPYILDGTLTIWEPKIVKLSEEKTAELSKPKQYLAIPKMNAFAKNISKTLNYQLLTEVIELVSSENKWLLKTQQHQDLYDWIVFAIPAPQLSKLLPTHVSFYPLIQNLQMAPCFSLLVGLKKPLNVKWDIAEIANSPIKLIINDHCKPGRLENASLVIHSNEEWSTMHLSEPKEAVEVLLQRELCKLVDLSINDIICSTIHLWRYSTVKPKSNASTPLIDFDNCIAACGDWQGNGTVESAFLNAHKLAKTLNNFLLG